MRSFWIPKQKYKHTNTRVVISSSVGKKVPANKNNQATWCKLARDYYDLKTHLSQVLEPSPQGVLRVVILKVLVGILTGPLTLRVFSLAPLIRSLQTFSKLFTFLADYRYMWLTKNKRKDDGGEIEITNVYYRSHLEVRVILMRWTVASSATPAFPASGLTAAIFA